MPANPTSNLTAFTAGDLVISISGDGDGSGAYTDNQASAITLAEVTTSGAAVGTLVLPQTTTIVNGTTEYAISGEYGSSSEGLLQLSADGQSLTIAGYGINAQTYNAGGAAVYGSAALAQTTSLTSATTVTPVARVVADISSNGTVDTSTALYNVYDTNNPRSVSTVDGTSFYLGGQGVKGDTTQGVFLAQDGAGSAIAIDTSTDVREAEIVNGQLYVSRDSTQKSGGTSNIASYGTTLPVSATTAMVLPGIAGLVTLTAAQANSVNASAVGTAIHLSPESYFFANATTLYVADGGNPKEGGLGDGGLQKWTFDGSVWNLDYTLSAGLTLVADTANAGTTGLIGLTGVVVGNTVQLYATNATLGDLDQTYLYGITDTLSATTAPSGESFTTLVTAAPDSNIRGVAFAPSASTATPVAITVPNGSTQTALSIGSGGTLNVLAGGAVIGATVLSGGTAVIATGGTDTGAIIGHGATETVLGTATGDKIDGTQIVSAATAIVNNETVYNGGAVDLFLKGAVANATTVLNGGTLTISGNATANNTVISSGGSIVLESPKAVLSGSVTFAGPGLLEATVVTSAAYDNLSVISGFAAGDVIDLTAVGAGATLAIAVVGGNTVATVTSGAVTQAFTFAGTAALPLTLSDDGRGGSAISLTAPTSTSVVVPSGSTQSGLVVSANNSLNVLAGGAIVGASILSGGFATIAGSDTNSVISAGGNELILGSASGDLVLGTQLISAGGAVVSDETVVNGGAIDLFLKGGVVNRATVSSGGALNINGNATANDTVLTGGGVLDLESPKANLGGALTFSGAGTLLVSDVISAGFGDLAVISGFGAGDAVDLSVIGTGATLSSAVVGGNTVETVTSGTTSESFIFAGAYANGFFSLTPDAGNGVMITANAVGTGPAPVTIGSGADSLVLAVSEDAYQGDAQFTISVDGVQQGGVQTATASHMAGQTQDFTVLGNFGTAPHSVAVDFLNDAYAGTADTDRNLYVTGATVDGTAIPNGSLAEYTAGTQILGFIGNDPATNPAAPAPVTVGSGPDSFALSISEDAYQGDAQFTVSVDGKQVGGTQTATALHDAGQSQVFNIDGSFGAGAQDVTVNFLNDAYAGTADTDRNLYVNAIGYNGTYVPSSTAALYTAGPADFAVPAAAGTAPANPDVLVIGLSEDAYNGDAMASIAIDGTTIGTPTVTYLNSSGLTQYFTYTGDFGGAAAAHTVGVDFLNDAYAGTSGMDRNLYVKSVSFDGAALPGDTSALYSGGTVNTTFQQQTIISAFPSSH